MLTVVLPAYNEEGAILPLLHKLLELIKNDIQNAKVIVVNDGSTDNTGEIVKSIGSRYIELIEHDRNRGLAKAVKTGLQHALQNSTDDDIIAIMDADNTHHPILLSKMIMQIQDGYDVVIASRYMLGSREVGVSVHRKLLSLTASLIFRLLFPIKGVKDYTCGYRVYRASILKKAFTIYGDSFIGGSGFSCMVDILLKLHETDALMMEVPLILRYDLKPTASKMDVKKTVQETLSLVFKRFIKNWR